MVVAQGIVNLDLKSGFGRLGTVLQKPMAEEASRVSH